MTEQDIVVGVYFKKVHYTIKFHSATFFLHQVVIFETHNAAYR